MKKALIKIVVIAALLFPVLAVAQKKEQPQYVTSVEGIKEYTLSNGLQVLLIPDPSQNNMVVNIVYKVGSKHEGYGEKGMAHLLEHMLFKSTSKLGDIKKMLSDKGGNANGTTYYDRTNYYEIFPYSEENLKWSLEMEADRMLNATLIQTDLDKEFSVVRNEFEIGENYPSSVLMSKVIAAGFLWHNYGNSTIGSKEDIERVTAAQLRKFYEKYYQPDNATLIIAGKFEEDKALGYVEQYFSVIPKPSRILEDIRTVEPAQDGEKFVELKRAGDSQSIGVMYHTAAFADPDYAALDVLSEILTNDPSGYLHKSLVETQKGSNIFGYQPEVRDAGFMYLGLEVPMGNNIQLIKEDLRTELDKVSNIAYTDQDVERAKTRLLKRMGDYKNNTIHFAINMTETVGSGDYRLAFLYRDYIEKMTAEDVKRVAKQYFKSNNRTVGVFIPAKDEQRTQATEFLNSDIAALTLTYKGKEQQADAKPFEPTIANLKANYTEGKLKNGLRYGVVDKEIKGSMVDAKFIFPVGNAKFLENTNLIATLMSALMDAGTQHKTKEQIQDRLNELKSSVHFEFYGQSLRVSISSYNHSFDEVMDVVRELLTESIFPESELLKVKTEYVTYFEGQLNDPSSIAFRELSRMTTLYPKSSVFYTPSIPEIIEQLKAITQKQVVDFYQNILGAEQGVGTIIGRSDKSNLDSVLDKTFVNFGSKVAYEKIMPTFFPTFRMDKVWNTVDKENATAAGRVSFKMNTKSSDYPALVIANEILGSGGFLAARIPMRLREKEGISYGAGSYVSVPIDDDVSTWTWYAYFNPTKKKDVEKAVLEELDLAIKKGFSEKELKDNIASWKVNRKTELGTDQALMQLSSRYLLRGVPFDDYDKLEQQVEKLTVKDINAALKKHIKPDQLSMIFVGDFDKK